MATKEETLKDFEVLKKLLNTIPSKFYLTDQLENLTEPPSYLQGKTDKNELKKKAHDSKRAKLDPDNKEDTVTAVEKHAKAKRRILDSLKIKTAEEEEVDSDEEQDDDDDEEDSDEEQDSEDEEEEEEDNEDEIKLVDNEDLSLEEISGAESETNSEEESDEDDEETEPKQTELSDTLKSLELANQGKFVAIGGSDKTQLHNKLKEKIQTLRNLRKADDPKRKLKVLAKRQKKNLKKQELKKKNKDKPTTKTTHEKTLVDESLGDEKKESQKKVSSVNMDADFKFGKFNFEGIEKKKKGSATAKQLLQKAETDKEKLTQLKKTDKQKAEALEKKSLEKKALQLATGEKVKDDPKLLKKTIKREQQKKNKSSRLWDDRKDKVKEDEAKKQKRRTDNLQKRQDSKKHKGNSASNKNKKSGKSFSRK